MRYLSERTSWVLFVISVAILVALGLAVSGITSRYAQSERWVAHTREVETWVARARADLFSAESARMGFVLSDDEARLAQYTTATQAIKADMDQLRSLTADNASQAQKLDALSPVIQRKIDLMRESIALRKSGRPDQQQQKELTKVCGQLTSQAIAMLLAMREEEGRLLSERVTASQETYDRVRVMLSVAFAVVLLLLVLIFQQLLSELKERRLAETAVRRLTSRVLDLQDAERRKVAREIHDSIGQYFAGLMMNLTILKENNAALEDEKRVRLLSDSLDLTQRGMAEARTMSHLLHPPLLDEVGFASAARWYVDGFTRRSGVQVELLVPDEMKRLPREVELVLFRTLQEGLTNVHKHSGSSSAKVRLQSGARSVTLTIEDGGKGLPDGMVGQFERTTVSSGVGLAGMRERVRDLGGEFAIRSANGTVLEVKLPIRQETAVENTPGNARGQAVPDRGEQQDNATASDTSAMMLKFS